MITQTVGTNGPSPPVLDEPKSSVRPERCCERSAITASFSARAAFNRSTSLASDASNVSAVSPDAASLTPRSEGGATAPAAASATASTIVLMRAIVVFVL